jgi:xyloglucan-specific endo-beta-1,4-glucanase
MKYSALISAIAIPLALVQGQSLCGTTSYWASSGYYFNNNEWNAGAGSGSNCIYVTDCWTTGTIFNIQWNWAGSSNTVKAYPYTGLSIGTGQSIGSIGSMPTEVYWSLTGSNMYADVSYDLFTASDPNHDTSYGEYELMIWYQSNPIKVSIMKQN